MAGVANYQLVDVDVECKPTIGTGPANAISHFAASRRMGGHQGRMDESEASGAAERCGMIGSELSALFERESAPVAQWIRAADFGLSRPMRCSPSVGGGA